MLIKITIILIVTIELYFHTPWQQSQQQHQVPIHLEYLHGCTVSISMVEFVRPNKISAPTTSDAG